jgi:hypothetical protein
MSDYIFPEPDLFYAIDPTTNRARFAIADADRSEAQSLADILAPDAAPTLAVLDADEVRGTEAFVPFGTPVFSVANPPALREAPR